MKAEVQDLSGSQKNITFEIPSEEVQEEIERYCKKLAKEVDVRGFRKGKAPVTILKRYFRDQIHKEVSSQLVASSLEKSIKEHSLTPLGEPEINAGTLVEGQDFTFTVKMDVIPKIDVKDYIGVEVQQELVRIGDKDVELALENLRSAHAEMKGVQEDQPAEEGNVVLVDYEATVQGKPFTGNSQEDVYVEIGSGRYPEEIEGGLIGSKVGETLKVQITFPEVHVNKEIAGKQVDYALRVKKIFQKELPSVDDEFAKDVGQYSNLEELKEKLREELGKEKTLRIRRRVEERILEKIIERNPIDAPRSLVEAQHKQLMDEARHRFHAKGLAMDPGTDDYQRLETNLSTLAEKQVLKELMVDAISKKEAINVSDEELEEKIKAIADRSGQSVDRVKGELQKEDGIERLRRSLKDDKTLDFLISKAKIDSIEEARDKT